MPKNRKNQGFSLFDCLDVFFIPDKMFSDYQRILGFTNGLAEKKSKAIVGSSIKQYKEQNNLT